jgi:hypothetical protein
MPEALVFDCCLRHTVDHGPRNDVIDPVWEISLFTKACSFGSFMNLARLPRCLFFLFLSASFCRRLSD